MQPQSDRPRRIALRAAAAAAAVGLSGIVAVGFVSMWRCGGFFGESSAIPGTLSEQLCREPGSRIMFFVVLLGPAAFSLLGALRAMPTDDTQPLHLAIAAGAAIPAGVFILYLVSGSL